MRNIGLSFDHASGGGRHGHFCLRLLIVACTLLGIVRGAALLVHDPLLAYANSYDEVRYSACFDLYPQRPREIPPTDNSPWAPFSHYVFIPGGAGQPMCYWSSELLAQAVVALGWKISEALRDGTAHAVRALGLLKFGLLAAIDIALSLAWWRRRRPSYALANAALLPLLFADPANTLYASTFYAEWTALTALYATLSLALLYADAKPTRLRIALLACAGLALGMSKLQHMLLPSLLALTMLLLAHGRERRWRWQGLALLAGGLLALALQVAQLGRSTPVMASVRLANAADVALTALLPASEYPARTVARLGLAPQCLAYTGRHAWELPNYDPEAACPGLAHFSRGKEILLLLSEPATALHLGLNSLSELDSWLAKGLGVVEGGAMEPLPADIPTLGRALSAYPAVRATVILLPLAVCAILLLRRRGDAEPHGVLFAALASTTIVATYGVTILGDGLADVAKQCHLLFDTALGWTIAGAVSMSARIVRQLHEGWRERVLA
jgi:hypothetical protein